MADSIVDRPGTDAPSLTVSVQPKEQTVVLALSGELDLASCPSLQAAVDAIDDAFREVELDLTGLGFIDSTGIGEIARMHRRFGPEFRELTVRCRLDGPVRRVLELSGIDRLVKVIDVDGAAP